MTVSAATSSIVYTADGTTAVFPYTWEIAQTADLIVYTVAVAATVAVKLALTSGYTVSGAGIATGGNVTLVAGNPATGTRVFIASDPALIQQLLLEQGIAFNPADVMAALDLLTRQVQATRRLVNGALQIPVAESLDGYGTTFPLKAGRTSGFVYFDPNGNVGIASGAAATPVSTAMTPVIASATLALARAAMGPWSDALVTAAGSTTARDLQTRFAEVADAKDYGAKGDGVTNDTVAIQAAHDALPASGGTLFFPSGTYVCNKINLSRANVRVLGFGLRAVTLKWTGVGSIGTQISEINNGTACLFITASNVEVNGIVVQGPSTAAYVARECGICAIGTSAAARITGLRVIDCEVTKVGAYAIFSLFSDRPVIERNYVHDCGYVGIECDSSDDGRILFNIVKTITPGTSGNMYGISVSHDNALWPGDQATSPLSKRWDIIGNHVEDIAWEGIDSHGSSFVFCAFNTVLNTKNGIGIASGSNGAANYGGTDNQIVHNHVETTGARANLAHGININGGSVVNAERCVVAYNTVIGKGITSQVGTGAIMAKFGKDCRIHDNVVNAWAGIGILLGTTMDNVAVRGNTFGADADAGETIGYCIYSPATTGDLSVEANRHEPRGGTAAKYGLRLDGPLAASAVSPVIGWNDFSQAVTGAYFVSSPCRPRGPGFGNVIDPAVAATTVDVSGATPGVPLVLRFNPTGGNVTVTNLTGAADGQVVTLTNINAAHTITFDRTAARLAGSASWVGGQYATLELVFNAGSAEWFERCRSTTNG